MIDIKDLAFSYGTHEVFKDFSTHISAGTITAIVGNNGAGKSTLLAAIAGEIKPLSGSISINGKMLGTLGIEDLAKIRALAQQSHSYWMAYTASQILKLGHENISSTRCDEIAQEFGISNILDQSITSLSGGQLQRIEIARAFMREVPLVLLDEPFASQDITSQESLIAHFKEEREKGRTIVLIAHREKSSLAWCDQIIDLG